MAALPKIEQPVVYQSIEMQNNQAANSSSNNYASHSKQESSIEGDISQTSKGSKLRARFAKSKTGASAVGSSLNLSANTPGKTIGFNDGQTALQQEEDKNEKVPKVRPPWKVRLAYLACLLASW